MASIYQHRRRIAGAAGSPSAAGSPEGEIAINFPGAAGTNGTPELWGFDGVGFRRLNPPGVAPAVKGITAVSGAAAVQAAFNADAITVAPGDIVIYTHAGTAYVYTGSTGAPVTGATAAQFTSLGAAMAVATSAQVRAGTNNAAAITPLGLSAVLPAAVLAAGVSGAQAGHPTNAAAATGAVGDAGRIVTLDATGHVPAALLSVQGLTFASQDLSVAPTGTNATHANGKIIVHSGADGAILNAGFTPVANPPATVNTGDMLLSDGTNWHHIENAVDLSNVVTKSGAQALANNWVATMAVPVGAGMLTRFDGTDAAKSQISNFNLEACVMNGGTY